MTNKFLENSEEILSVAFISLACLSSFFFLSSELFTFSNVRVFTRDVGKMSLIFNVWCGKTSKIPSWDWSRQQGFRECPNIGEMGGNAIYSTSLHKLVLTDNWLGPELKQLT
jgi:hypothetical protein